MDLELTTDRPYVGFELDEEYELYHDFEDVDITLDEAVNEFISMFGLDEDDVNFQYENIEDFTVCYIDFEIDGQKFKGRIV